MDLHTIKGKSKDSIKEFVHNRYKDNKLAMTDLYKSWLINLAWVRGKQNYDYDIQINRFVKSKRDPWRSRLQSNRMLPLVRRNVARLIHTTNVWDVIPATPDEEDIQISRTSTGVLQDTWQRKDLPKLLTRVAFWQETVSNCFVKVGWDAEAGSALDIDPADVEPDLLAQFLDRSGFAGAETEAPANLSLPSGDIFFDIVPPFHLTIDPMVDVFEDSDYAIESRLRSRDWIVEKFGKKFAELPETDAAQVFLHPYFYSDEHNHLDVKGVLVHELMVKRNNKYKNGLYALMADDGTFLIKPHDLPFQHGELPYAHFVSIFDPASVWGTCIAEQIRPNQARYNAMRGAVTDHIRQMGKVQWLNPRQSGIKQFTNRPGEVYNYNAPYKPEQLQPKPLPGYISEELSREVADIQDTTSTHDVTQGKAEPGIRSGKAVSALQEADELVLGPKLLWYDTQIQRLGRLALQTIAQYVPEERILQIRGEFNEMETMTFTGQDLIGKATNADYWKVRVKTIGRQAMSREGREGMVRTLLELGILNPITDRDQLLHIIGTSEVMHVFDETEMDRTRQWKEIQAIQQGQDVPVIQGEDHDTHIRMIKRFLASSKRESLTPEQIQAIVKHLDNHEMMRANELAKQQAYMQNSLAQLGVSNVQPQQ